MGKKLNEHKAEIGDIDKERLKPIRSRQSLRKRWHLYCTLKDEQGFDRKYEKGGKNVTEGRTGA